MKQQEGPKAGEPGVPAKALNLGKDGAAGAAGAGAAAADGGAPAGGQPEEAVQPEGAATSGSGKGLGAFILILVAAVLVGGGFWIGKATTDPTVSDEYVALAATADQAAKARDTFEQQRDRVQAELGQLESSIKAREDAADAKVAALDGREAAVKTAEDGIKAKEAAVKKREDAVTGAEKKKAANTVGDGTWTVGVDIEPGTYRSNDNVGSTCYWGIYLTGSNGDDIITNDLPGGGRPSVTLAPGQDFNSTRCGTWSKQ